ncbi:unnamed protein product [Clavelina lepadiformis]|uniref:Uncharacterized protein n=1 Tax=Clavelina lepadiformis TaxID=159417 RepID=A0ABP0GBM3_CLALP
MCKLGTPTDLSRYDGNMSMCSSLLQLVSSYKHHSLTSTLLQQRLCKFFRLKIFLVGFESGGAHPGPTCYRKGDALTVTDVNLFVGRLLPYHMHAVPLSYYKCQVISMEVISTLASISWRTCQVIHGSAIIVDKNSTILVEPDCKAEMTKKGDVTIMIGKGKPKHIGKELDDIQFSIFSHRFMSIAEQMGRILQRTAISINIKE